MKEPARKKSKVEQNESNIVAQVTEVGDSAFAGSKIPAGGGHLDHRGSGPEQSDGCLVVKIIPSASTLFLQYANQRIEGIQPEPEEGVTDPWSQHLEPGHGNAELTTPQTFPGNFRAKNRLSKHHRFRVTPGCSDERFNPP